jgi:hypothetical protein
LGSCFLCFLVNLIWLPLCGNLVLFVNRLSLTITSMLLCAIVLASTATVKADSTPTVPAVPQFSLKLVDDQVIITIKNQPVSGEAIYYNAREKLHTDTGWAGSFYIDDAIGTFDCMPQSTSDVTVITSSVPTYAINSQLDIQVESIPQYSSQFFVLDHPYGFL